MREWLRLLMMMFYAPARALAEVHARAPLLQAVALALVAQTIYALVTQWQYLSAALGGKNVFILLAVLVQAASAILFAALILVPALIVVSNVFERRGSAGLVVQQEYAGVASTVFYASVAADLMAVPLALLSHVIGLHNAFANWYLNLLAQTQRDMPNSPLLADAAQMSDPSKLAIGFFHFLTLPFFFVLLVVGARRAFRFSWPRSISVIFLSGIIYLIAAWLSLRVLRVLCAVPFMLFMLLFLLRGYFNSIMQAQRASAAFKQNLEAAALNPADASAHYNLGLIHQGRGELELARERFERAIQIDPEEVDAHYQLGRIARAQGKLADAIKHYEQVVARDEAHAQHEIWREIGATYISAGQFNDARTALERFFEHRPNDPEGLYLMGRAYVGLGRRREAIDLMRACIEAVRTAPAYKRRTEKRWLNEAQQSLKAMSQE
jgi:tetratricopeptide (TPR) repeat protein